jgi:hypothetical protein
LTKQYRSAVIVAAGTLNTPKLLIQSGIGPKHQADLVLSKNNHNDKEKKHMKAKWIVNENLGRRIFDTHQVAGANTGYVYKDIYFTYI